MCSNLHMPETPPGGPADTFRPDCHHLHGPATRVVEWHEPDTHSATGDETYGPFHLLVCSRDDCLTDAVDQAHNHGGIHVDHYHATAADLAAICAEAAS